MSLRRWDVLLAMGLATASIAISVAGLNQHPWAAVLAIPLGLVLPGYALSVLLLSRLDRADRLLCTLALSLIVAVLGGLVLNATPWGLRSVPWALWLGGVTLVAGLAVLFRDTRSSVAIPPMVPGIQARPLVGLGAALVVGGLAVAISYWSAAEAEAPFTELWAVPDRAPQAYAIQVGVRNQEGRRMIYRVSVEEGNQQLADWPQIVLDPGTEWTQQLDLSGPPTDPTFVLLYRQQAPTELYRWVEVSPASFAREAGPVPQTGSH